MTAHTRTPSLPGLPDHCAECTERERAVVAWPCEGATKPYLPLREAAKLLRAGRTLSPEALLAVAALLDSEAVVMGELEPFLEYVNAVVTSGGGPETVFRFGRNADGSPAMIGDTSAAALALASVVLADQKAADCGCHACNPKAWWMVCCRTCGNKRCPRAASHDNECSGSNEAGRPGTRFPAAPSTPTREATA